MKLIEKIEGKFISLYKKGPILIKAPGRINLIGEHTDYNDGFVLPAAVNKHMYFAMQTNDEKLFRFYAMDMNESFEIDIKRVGKTDIKWANYLIGVISQIQNLRMINQGVDCVFGGEIQVGMGMSSSAALECGYAFGINHLFSLNLDNMEMAVICQLAEHQYAGVKCGIMDQFSVLFGKHNQFIQLDCRSITHKYIPIDLSDYSIVLCDTLVSHSLASSEYNKRRKECEQGVEFLKRHNSNLRSLRDVTLEFIQQHKSEMDAILYRRCEYVVKENQRVLDACDALGHKDFQLVGKLMYQSHEGLRDDYEVSCKELDELVEIAKSSEGVVGARMMGGGFGGCTINLVENNYIDSFCDNIKEKYYKPKDLAPNIIIANIEKGVSTINNVAYAT